MSSLTVGPATAIRVRSARMDGIDTMRLFAFVAVVVLHAVPSGGHVDALIGHAARFAVPFFFVTSGFFLSSALSKTQSIWKIFKRIAPVFLVWLIVYVLATGADFSWLKKPDLIARYLLTGGPAYHLWYLPALGCSLAVVVLARESKLLLVCLAAAFFLAGLAFGPYREVLGLPDPPIGMRNGPFFGLPFVVCGYLLARTKTRLSLSASVLMIALGMALQVSEAYLLTPADEDLVTADYFLGTLPFGIGVFCLAFHLDDAFFSRDLAELGRMSLWMYCIHALFLMWLTSFDPARSAGLVVLVACVVGFSVVTALIASRIPLVRALVR